MKSHEFIFENSSPYSASDTVTLFHGGKNLENSYRDVPPSVKGRWEYGPGLYLTNSYSRAQEYARGGRKVYRVTIRKGTPISKVKIQYEDVAKFASDYIPKSLRSRFLTRIQDNMKRMNNSLAVEAAVFLNLVINDQAVPSTKTNAVTRFLTEHGVDYAIDRFGGFEGEMVVVLFNRDLIIKVVPARESGSPDYTMQDISKLNETIQSISGSNSGGSLEGYVVDTNKPQLRNYLESQKVSDDLIDSLVHRFNRIAIIKNMMVDDESRGQGYGSDLLSNCIDKAYFNGAQAILLVADIHESNEFNLIDWYKNYGFEVIGNAAGDPLMLLDEQ